MDVTDTVKPSTQAPPTTERKEELLKEVKSTKKQTTPKSAVQLQKEAEEDAQVKRVSITQRIATRQFVLSQSIG